VAATSHAREEDPVTLIRILPLLFVLALGACKKDGEEIADELATLKKQVCACQDEACAEAVSEKRRELRRKAKEKYQGKDKDSIDKGVMERLNKLDDEFRACRNRFRGDDL
jgi:hypothetical protein